MLVLVVSECRDHGRDQAWTRTQRVVDQYLERAGRRTWRGRLTAEGLRCLRRDLNARASANTAVAASRVVGRKRFELEWIVGSTKPFGRDGQVVTYAGHAYDHHLGAPPQPTSPFPEPLLDACELAGWWHDVGKATEIFAPKVTPRTLPRHAQNDPPPQTDPVRHEIVSAWAFRQTLRQLLDADDDLSSVEEDRVDVAMRSAFATPLHIQTADTRMRLWDQDTPQGLRVAAWLIASHHRLMDAPAEADPDLTGSGVFKLTHHVRPDAVQASPVRVDEVWPSLLTPDFVAATTRLIQRLAVTEGPPFSQAAAFGRLGVILADRFVSSREFDPQRHPAGRPDALIANTEKIEDEDGNRRRVGKQTVVEHNERIGAECRHALADLALWRAHAPHLSSAGLPRALRRRTTGRFAWQSEAADALDRHGRPNVGFFAFTMAATGAGKTRGCARILAAVDETVRYVLATPRRTLTLQAGADYRRDLHLDDHDVATVIGDTAVRELFEIHDDTNGSESANWPASGGLFGDEDGEASETARLMQRIPDRMRRHLTSKKTDTSKEYPDRDALRLLAPPILVATIDQLIPAADGTRTSHLPALLRLMTSDLVLDEVDSLSSRDLVAVGRLVFLAGLLGRRVMLSSATLPPEAGLGLFRAYQQGYQLHVGADAAIDVAWFADRGERVRLARAESEDVAEADAAFRARLADDDVNEPAPRQGTVLTPPNTTELARNDAFSIIFDHVLEAYRGRKRRVRNTRQHVSAVLVQFAHVESCVRFARWLDRVHAPDDTSVKHVVYHARYPLLIRSGIEGFLDRALKRSPQDRFAGTTEISSWRASSGCHEHILFVIATSVAGLGRDHDYDCAVIEPVSISEAHQTSGRVERHRRRGTPEAAANVALLPTSMRWFAADKTSKTFTRPGVEGKAVDGANLRLSSRWLADVIDADWICTPTSAPLISDRQNMEMSGLEREALRRALDAYSAAGFATLPAYWRGGHWLAAIHPKTVRFRDGLREPSCWLDPVEEVFKNHRDQPISHMITLENVAHDQEGSSRGLLFDANGEWLAETRDAVEGRNPKRYLHATLPAAFENSDPNTGVLFDPRYGMIQRDWVE